MTKPEAQTRRPIRVAIIVVAVALAVVVALVAYLTWGRDAVDSPTPTPSASPSVPAPTASAPGTTATPEPPDSEQATPSPTATSSSGPASATETPTVSGAPSDPPAAAQTMMWEGKASFENFTVEVPRDNDVPASIEGKAALLVEVCLTKSLDDAGKTRISWDPWTLEDSDGNVNRPVAGGYEPAFPADDEYVQGECARGYLTFDQMPPNSDFVNLVYENGLRDRAVWQFH